VYKIGESSSGLRRSETNVGRSENPDGAVAPYEDGWISFTKCLSSYLRCILMLDDVSFNHVTHRTVLAIVLISHVYMISVLSFSSGNPNTLKPNVFVTITSGIIGYTPE